MRVLGVQGDMVRLERYMWNLPYGWADVGVGGKVVGWVERDKEGDKIIKEKT